MYMDAEIEQLFFYILLFRCTHVCQGRSPRPGNWTYPLGTVTVSALHLSDPNRQASELNAKGTSISSHQEGH